jgi:hypothetical protein
MKFEIETYKGFEIVYNDDSDKFECSMELNDNVKNAKRGSLADMRKEIDQFIKANFDFKPFWFFTKHWSDSFKAAYCSGIRTDGKLVAKDKVDSKRFDLYGERDVKKMFVFDPELAEELDKAHNEKVAALKKYEEKTNAIVAKLVPLDVSKYNLK